MDADFYRNLLSEAPIGYAYHRIVTDGDGVPVDYVFLEVNTEFERLTGLDRKNILNRKITEVLPGIREGSLDWVAFYGDVALKGGRREFEQLSEPLNRTYKVQVYSPEKGYFVTLFSDISSEMKITEISRDFLEHSAEEIDYRKISDSLIEISGAKYVTFNLFEENGRDFSTVALSGINAHLKEASGILGFDVVGKKWSHDPGREKLISHDTITRFETLKDLVRDVLPRKLTTLIEKSFGLGPVYVVRVMKKEQMLGDFTLLMGKGEKIKNEGMVGVFAAQVGLLLDRFKVQQNLEASQDRLELAMDAGEHGFWDWNLDTDEIYFSPRYYTMLGYGTGELPMSKDTWIGLMHPEDRERVVPEIEGYVRRGEPYSVEFRMKCKGGDWKWISGRGKSFDLDDHGYPHRAVGIHVDIDEAKRAEQNLRRERENQKILLDNIKAQVWYLKDEETYGAVNRAHAEFNGMDVEEIAFKNMYDLFPAEVVETCRESNHEVFSTGKTVRTEEWVPTPSGAKRLLSIRKSPVLNEEGEIDYVVCSAEDITRRKNAEIALRENEERFSLALEGTGAGLWDWDMVTDTVFFSPLWKSMLGYEDDEVENTFDGWRNLWHPEDVDHINAVIEDHLKGRTKHYQVEHRLRHKNGEWRWILTRGAIIKDGEGNPLRWVGTNLDITANKRLQEEFRETRDFLHSVLESIHDGISVLETDYTIRHVNHRMEEWYSDSMPLTGKKCYQAYQGRETLCEDCPVQRALESRQVESSLVRGGPAEGIEWIELFAYPMIDEESGEIRGVIELVRDITDRKRIEDRLSSSEKNFRTFFETVDDMIFIGNQQGEIFFTNSAVNRKLGYTPEELGGMHVLDVHSSAHRSEAEVIFAEMFAGTRDFCPLPLEGKEGQLIPVETRVWFGEWDEKPCIFGISKDLSREQSALQKFNKLFDRNPALMAVSDLPDRRFTEVNDTFLDKLGYTRDEIIGKTSNDLGIFFEEEKQELIAKELEKEGRIINCDLKVQAKDGTLLDGLFSGEVIESQGGLSFLTVMTDLTDQRRAEEQAEFQRSQIQSLFEYSSAAMVMMDLDNHVLDANRAFEKVFGFSFDEVKGKVLEDLICPARFYDIQSKELDEHALEGIKGTDIIRKRKDGTEIHVRVSAGPIKNNGEITGRFAIFDDVTEQKKAEEDLAEANRHLAEQTILAREMAKQAEMASRAKSEFLANMSHEIRTPMNAVVGFTDLLLTSKLSEIQRQYLENVHSSADALLVLINDILDFSKIEAGRLELDLNTIDLRDQLEKAMDIVTFKAHEKDLELILDIDPNLPEFVIADSVRINQIVTNLLSNAVKFTESGEVELKARNCEGATPGTVTISVRDTGIGMKPEQKKKIFESFTQADHSTTRKYGGTGLGLSISKSLVEKMGGELDLESVPGEGSTFSFTLSFEVEKMKTHTSQPGLKIKKVLVVDDNFNNRTILEAMFSHWGIETELVTNGIEALGKLKGEGHFDVVILDYHMPFMDGLDVAEKIRDELKLTPEKEPIILLYSSADDPRVFERCKELNIEYKLVKPIKMKQLHDLLLQVQMGPEERKTRDASTKGRDPGHGPEATHSPSTEEGMSGKKQSILVAEDNPPNMLLARGLLGKMLPDAVVIEAKNGREAVEKFREKTPDLILMDVQMPELDGYGATAEIRALEAEAGVHTPIIALTAGALEGDREKCLVAGMDDYLSKPIMIGDLRERITKWLLTSSRTIKQSKEPVGEDGLDPLETAKKFLSSQGHDAHTIDEMLKMVRARVPEILTELRDSLASGEAEKLRRAAHSLKGIVSTLGLEKVESLAMETEKASVAGRIEEAMPHTDALVQECEEFLKLFSGEEA